MLLFLLLTNAPSSNTHSLVLILQEYKLLREGRSSRLTLERINLLVNINFVWEAQRGGPRKRRPSDADSAQVGNVETLPKPKKTKRLKPKATKKRTARGPKAAVFAGAEFMELAANAALPSIVPQQQGLERSPHLQQEESYSQTASLPNIHHQQGVHLSQSNQQQTMLPSRASYANAPSPSNSLASSYARNAAAAAASAQQATAAANVAVAAAANFLRQGAPPSETTDSSYASPSYNTTVTNAAIDWHRNAAQEAVHQAANQQQIAMEAIHNESQTAQANEAHAKAQAAQAHALLQQQHAQAAQRTALAVQHQQQAAEALARFGAVATSMAAHQAPSMAVSSSGAVANAPGDPYQTPSTMQMPPSWNHHDHAADHAAANLQKDTQQRQQLVDSITSTSTNTTIQSSPALPPIQPQLSVRQQMDLRRRHDAATAAEIFSNEAGAITITVPPTQKEVDAAREQHSTRRSAPPVVTTTNDGDAGIFDDAEDDEDFTAQFR